MARYAHEPSLLCAPSSWFQILEAHGFFLGHRTGGTRLFWQISDSVSGWKTSGWVANILFPAWETQTVHTKAEYSHEKACVYRTPCCHYSMDFEYTFGVPHCCSSFWCSSQHSMPYSKRDVQSNCANITPQFMLSSQQEMAWRRLLLVSKPNGTSLSVQAP